MPLKQSAAIALLAFVAATCVVLIVRAVDRPAPSIAAAKSSPGPESSSSAGPESLAGPTLAPQTAATASRASAMPDGVHVYYLHGNIRCRTCRTIEAYTKEAVETGFASELQSGRVTWRAVNYDQPSNWHYLSEYEVVAPTVVLAKWQGGKQVDWRNLKEVWEYVRDKEALQAFVQRHLREFLGQPTVATKPSRDGTLSRAGAGGRLPSELLPVPPISP